MTPQPVECPQPAKGNPMVGLAKSKTNIVTLAVGFILNWAARRFDLQLMPEDYVMATTIAMYGTALIMRFFTSTSLAEKGAPKEPPEVKMQKSMMALMLSPEFAEQLGSLVERKIDQGYRDASKPQGQTHVEEGKPVREQHPPDKEIHL